MKQFFNALPVALLIALLVYAACSKLFSFSLFRVQLNRQTFPQAWTNVFVYAIPAAELLAAALLLFGRTLLCGLAISLILLVAFTVYIALVLAGFWDRVPCPCGGILNHLSWAAHLAFNLAFIVVNLIAIHIQLKERRLTANMK